MKASLVFLAALGLAAAACSKSSTPATPVAPSANGPKLTAPIPDSPADSAAVPGYRPTFVVRNGSSDQSGQKLYEFQISDSSSFPAAATTRVSAFAVLAHQTGIPEGANGTTAFTPDFDLQPTTRLYWRSRMLQGVTASDWSPTRSFTTPIGGYNRAGELYDPLVNGVTVGIQVGSTTFIPGSGLRLNDENSYVRYQLVQPLDSGEYSMEVSGLHPAGIGPKLRVFSMSDGTGDSFNSQYLLNAQYRGLNGGPEDCITFKAVLGDPAYKLEPDLATRNANIIDLDPGSVYFWKGTWANFFQLTVREGINGRTIYDVGVSLSDLGVPANAARYNPTPHYAYLGSNNGPFKEENGSFPGAIYRNVWLGRGARPASLGSALLPR